MNKPTKAKPSTPTTPKNKGGRPARPMPELIPDTPENIAKAAMMGPPKKQWQYLNKD